MIYHTLGEHANHYTTDAVTNIWNLTSTIDIADTYTEQLYL